MTTGSGTYLQFEAVLQGHAVVKRPRCPSGLIGPGRPHPRHNSDSNSNPNPNSELTTKKQASSNQHPHPETHESALRAITLLGTARRTFWYCVWGPFLPHVVCSYLGHVSPHLAHTHLEHALGGRKARTHKTVTLPGRGVIPADTPGHGVGLYRGRGPDET